MKKQPRLPSYFSLKKLAIALIILLVTLLGVLGGYFLGFRDAEEELARERKKTEHLVQQIKQATTVDESNLSSDIKGSMQDAEIRRLRKELDDMLVRERAHEEVKPDHEYAPSGKKSPPPPPSYRAPRAEGAEAKLVIIIDDVSYARDVKAIQSTGLPLVMSFLPPSPRHPDSAFLAKQQGNYMVHLPLEAVAFHDEEPGTLRIGSSDDEIEKRLNELKQLYPNVRYMNNHTGSKFTSDSAAMERLLRIMKKEGIQFVDSRTIGTSKAREATEKNGMRYLSRDVFLDDQDGVGNVKKQIKEAVDKAKRYGSAIAIGHPRKDTIKALQESKELLGQVKLVGIDQI